MNKICAFLSVLSLIACTRHQPSNEDVLSAQTTVVASVDITNKTETVLFVKELREAIYFANSLEREALKLITADRNYQKNSLFSVLSYIVETQSGVKKSSLLNLDCNSFDFKKDGPQISILKKCFNPSIEAIRIKTYSTENFSFEFFIKEWASVVGATTVLTNGDVICDIELKNKKVHLFRCDNWSFQTKEEMGVPIIFKAQTFKFVRDSKEQFVILGGFQKELVQIKKIDIRVPMEGKIKIFEKEIEVIDEFLPVLQEMENGKKEDNQKNIEKETKPEEGQQEQGPNQENQNQENSNQEGRPDGGSR